MKLYKLICALLVILVLAFLGIVALRELTYIGALSVFLLMTSVYALTLCLTRYLITCSLVFVALINAIDAANRFKLNNLKENIHFTDLFLLFEYVGISNLGMVRDYVFQSWHLPAIAVGAVSLLAACISAETAYARRSGMQSRWPMIAFSLSGVMLTTSFYLHGNFHAAIVRQNFFVELISKGPLQTSQVVSLVRELIVVAAARAADKYASVEDSRLSPEPCVNCPDLVVMHVESVFDPVMLASYSSTQPLHKLIQSGMQSTNGFLKTNVFGGRSIISEFELHCSINHYALGRDGEHPSLFLRPFIKRCTPGLLRDAGYEVIVLYSFFGNDGHTRDVFKKYGATQFLDPKDMGIAFDSNNMRDHIFVDRIIDILKAPRTKPRLIYASTYWNHGPHGTGRIKGIYPGPYDTGLAENPQVKDYINRLNDTVIQLSRLENEIKHMGFPAAVLHYGDHQPAMRVTYSPDARDKFGAATPFVTFYRMARNWTADGIAEQGPYMRIEELLPKFLDFAGTKRFPELKEIHRLVESCPDGDQTQCDQATKRKLRSVIAR